MPIVRGARPADAFLALNLAGFLALAGVLATARYDGPGNVLEFFVSACAIMAIIAIAWARLRHLHHPLLLLALIEIGLVAHFAGAFVPVAGTRLYDQALAGIGYDNLVHALNAFAGAAFLDHLLQRSGLLPALRRWVLPALVLGAGAIVEIVEFGTLQLVPSAGIGGYENNARDLLADLAGACAFLPFVRVREPV